jgi:acetylornithine deacetylase/succinyl-diaminopimelate desuccinylase-like protein
VDTVRLASTDYSVYRLVSTLAGVSGELLTELAEWIAIPSVSADPARAADVERAGDWIVDKLRAAGAAAERIDWHGQPLVVGEIAASGGRQAPTVLCYGHFDVQAVDPLELWESDPFTLVERNGWLYGRGCADDKGQLFMLLEAARSLARENALPVNVRFICDGEEEIGGGSIAEFLAADERGADACLIFDTAMIERDVPAFTIASRGLAYFHLELESGERDLHSGVYGGAALNAVHALTQTLAALLPSDGRLPEALMAGVIPPSAEELAAVAALPSGERTLADQGARPSDANAAAEFYQRTCAWPSLDVNGIEGGSPHLQKTVLPVRVQANLSIRLAPGQDVVVIGAALERLLAEAAPVGTELRVQLLSASAPALVDSSAPAIQLARTAFERSFGRRPLLVRIGGTLPIMPALQAKGIPAIVTGFDLPEGNIHSPNERFWAGYLEPGIAVAKAILTELGTGLGQQR